MLIQRGPVYSSAEAQTRTNRVQGCGKVQGRVSNRKAISFIFVRLQKLFDVPRCSLKRNSLFRYPLGTILVYLMRTDGKLLLLEISKSLKNEKSKSRKMNVCNFAIGFGSVIQYTQSPAN